MLLNQAAQQYRLEDRQRFMDYIRSEPLAAAQLRAPLYEDKVVDFLFDKAEITDREVTKEELEAAIEAEEGHVHGPDCGHDHGAKPAAKKKAPAKKAKAEEAPAAEGEAEPVKKPAAKKAAKAEGEGEEAAPKPKKAAAKKKADAE